MPLKIETMAGALAAVPMLGLVVNFNVKQKVSLG